MEQTVGLNFAIDTSDARRARDDLRDMHDSAGRAAQSAQQLGQAYASASSGTQQFSQQTRDLTQNINASVSSLDMLIDRMRSLTSVFASSGNGFGQLREVTAQVDSLGRMFNVTAAGLEDFNRAARGVGFSTSETLSALRNMQAALEGVTAAGRSARQVMTGYGVDFNGIGTNNPGELLTRARSAFNSFAPDALTQRDMMSVFGSLSPEAMTSLRQSDIRMPWQRQADSSAVEAARRTAAAREDAIAVIQPQMEARTKLSAYQDRYDEWWSPIGRAFNNINPFADDVPLSRRNADYAASGDRQKNMPDTSGSFGGYNGPRVRELIERNRQGDMNYDAFRENLEANYVYHSNEGVSDPTLGERALRIGSLGMVSGAQARYTLGSLTNWWMHGNTDDFRTRLATGVPTRPVNPRISPYDQATGSMMLTGGMSSDEMQQRSLMTEAAQGFGVDSAAFGMMSTDQIGDAFGTGTLGDDRRAAIGRRRAAIRQNEINAATSRMQAPLLVQAMQSRSQTDAIGGGGVDLADQPQYAQLLAQAMEKFRNDSERARDFVREIAQGMQDTERAANSANAIRSVASMDAATLATTRRGSESRMLAAFASPSNNNIFQMGLNQYTDANAERMLTETQVASARGREGQDRTDYLTSLLRPEQRNSLRSAYMEQRESGITGQLLNLNVLQQMRRYAVDANPANAEYNAGEMAFIRASMNPATEANAPYERDAARYQFVTGRMASGERTIRGANDAAGIARVGAAWMTGGELPAFSAPQPNGPAGAEAIARQAMGMFDGLRITSVNRDPATNAAVGGASNSMHMHGNAVDMDMAQLPEARRAELVQYLRQNPALGGMGMYGADSTLLHIDTREGQRVAWGPQGRSANIEDTPGYFREGLPAWLSASRAGAAPSGPARASGALGDVGAMSDADLRRRVYGGGTFAAYSATQMAINSNQISLEQAPEMVQAKSAQEFATAVNQLAAAAARAALEVKDLGERAGVAGGTVYEQQRLAVAQNARNQAEPARQSARNPEDLARANEMERQLRERGYARINTQNQLDFAAEGKDLTNRASDSQYAVDNFFLSSPRLAEQMAIRRTERTWRDRMGEESSITEADVTARAQQAGKVANLEDTARQNQLIRDSFVSVGDAGINALDSITTRGVRANDAMRTLLSTTTSIFERLAGRRIMNGVMDSVGNRLQSWLGGGSSGSGGGGSAIDVGTSDLGTGFVGTGTPNGAQGLVFGPAGIVPMAQGGIYSSPTYVPMAGGGTALVGEAGEEAAMPLVRGPDGRLGVSSYGGGGGPVFHVNVTANPSSGSNAQDTAHAQSMAKEITGQMREMVLTVMRDQLRPGGMYGPGGGMR